MRDPDATEEEVARLIARYGGDLEVIAASRARRVVTHRDLLEVAVACRENGDASKYARMLCDLTNDDDQEDDDGE